MNQHATAKPKIKESGGQGKARRKTLKSQALEALRELGPDALFDVATGRSLLKDARIKPATAIDDACLAQILDRISRSYVHQALLYPLDQWEIADLEALLKHLRGYQTAWRRLKHLPQRPYGLGQQRLLAAKWDIECSLELKADPNRKEHRAVKTVVAELAGLYKLLTTRDPKNTATDPNTPRKAGIFVDLLHAYETLLHQRLKLVDHEGIILRQLARQKDWKLVADTKEEALRGRIRRSLKFCEPVLDPVFSMGEPEVLWITAHRRYQEMMAKALRDTESKQSDEGSVLAEYWYGANPHRRLALLDDCWPADTIASASETE